MPRRPRTWGTWLRRTTQVFCLALFVGLFVRARFRDGVDAGPVLHLFFHINPLILLATFLSAHALHGPALLALVTVAATLLLGRVFCGWICPLGTINHFVGWLRRPVRGLHLEKERWSPWQRTKYLILIALLTGALFGVHWIGVFDPISLLYRSMTAVVLPGAQYAVEDASTAVYRADPPLRHLSVVTEPVYSFTRNHVFLTRRQVFQGGGLLFLLFLGIVLLNLVRPRFWCRYLCPLGAMLGLLARRPLLLRLVRNTDACNECGRCAIGCQGASAPGRGEPWLAAECFACWNCVSTCNFQALRFRIEPPFRKRPIADIDLSRRAAISAAAGGLAGIFLFRLEPQAQAKTYNPALVRPPGARSEREFLARCLQCGMCMKVCPTNALQPTLFEAGLEGIWTPIVVPRIGYCEFDCNLCGQACPTEAIEPLALETKKEVKIGIAAFDVTRCLPYAYGRDCIVCEEHCPVPGKAIYVVEREVALRGGAARVVKQPQVDPDKCIGCGVCEWSCPWEDVPAIRVTSANESRHPKNQPILPGFDFGTGFSPVTGGDDPPSGDYGGSPY